MPNLIPISTITVGSGGSGSIQFTSIPQSYTDLLVKYSFRNTTSNGTVYVYYNDNTTAANYTYKQAYGNGTSGTYDSQSEAFFGVINRSTYTTNTFSNGDIYIASYTNSLFNKLASAEAVSENNSTEAIASIWGRFWNQTSSITSIKFVPYIGTFDQYSSVSLYGIRRY